jgi:hypothetical protein
MMSAYVHDVPGRLRIKHGAFVRNQPQLERVSSFIANLAGVHRVETNPVIGSVLVHYDPESMDSAALLSALKTHGHIPETIEPHVAAGGASVRLSGASEVVLNSLLEIAVERSTRALVCALL